MREPLALPASQPCQLHKMDRLLGGAVVSKQASAAVWIQLAHKVAAVPAIPAIDTTAAIPAIPEHSSSGYEEWEVMHITQEYLPNNPEYIGYWTFSDDVNVFLETFNQNWTGILHVYNHISKTLEHKISGTKLSFRLNQGGKIDDFQPISEKHYRDLAEVRSLAPRGVLVKVNEMLKFESMRTKNYLSPVDNNTITDISALFAFLRQWKPVTNLKGQLSHHQQSKSMRLHYLATSMTAESKGAPTRLSDTTMTVKSVVGTTMVRVPAMGNRVENIMQNSNLSNTTPPKLETTRKSGCTWCSA
ncbi:hypothetical protein DFJ73DRAFT_767293 [Zopfochytrium polystomum]|nr:hypothetical protein DFJ73DRAFT_767293 [Zopfochytrium polystomum]